MTRDDQACRVLFLVAHMLEANNLCVKSAPKPGICGELDCKFDFELACGLAVCLTVSLIGSLTVNLAVTSELDGADPFSNCSYENKHNKKYRTQDLSQSIIDFYI